MSTQPNPSDQHIRQVPCHACGLPHPADKAHSIKGRYYCTNCLVTGADLAGLVNEWDLSNYSAGRAALFGLLPGLGAVYNNQYVKAVQHFAVFAGLVMLADYFIIFIFATIVFYFYTIIDAYRSAQEIIRGKIRQAQTGEPTDDERENVPLWGLALIALGTLFFLDNLDVLRVRYLVDFAWPLVFVAIGLYLVFDFYRRKEASGQRTEPAYTGGGGYTPPSRYGGGESPPPPQPPGGGVPEAPPAQAQAPEADTDPSPAPSGESAEPAPDVETAPAESGTSDETAPGVHIGQDAGDAQGDQSPGDEPARRES